MPTPTRPLPRPEPRPDLDPGRENSAIFTAARPAIVELGGRFPVPWEPGALRWRVGESGAIGAVADLGVAPLVELADRLGPVSDWALVVAPGAELAGRRLLETAPGIWSVAIVPFPLSEIALGRAERVCRASTDRERWAVAAWVLARRCPG